MNTRHIRVRWAWRRALFPRTTPSHADASVPDEASARPKRRANPMDIPTSMVVPAMRRDTSCVANVHWLLRNLTASNPRHPELNEVMEWLRQILKGERRTS